MKIQTALSTMFVTGAGLILIGQAPIASAGPGPGDHPDDQARHGSKAQQQGDKVQFEAESDVLDSQAQQQLDRIASWAMENQDRTVVIAGSTTGDQQLGTRRADAAKQYLIQAGVPADRIRVMPYGQQAPQAEEQQPNMFFVVVIDREQQGQQPQQQLGQPGDELEQQDPMAQPTEPVPPEPREPIEPREPQEPMTGEIDEPGMDDPDLTDPDDPWDDEQAQMEPMPPPQPAQQPEGDDGRPAHLVTPAGMSINLGGGVLDYFDDETRDFTGTAGFWEARLTYGTRAPIGIEAAYVGFAQSVDALGLDDDAYLLGSMGEAAVRFNVPLGIQFFQPYVFGGAGVTRVDVVNEDFNTSNVEDKDTSYHIPAGLGLAFRYSGLLFDLRGTVRPTIDDELLAPEATPTNNSEARLHNWSAGGKVGFEF